MPTHEYEYDDDVVAKSLPSFIPPETPPLPELNSPHVDHMLEQPPDPGPANEVVSQWMGEAWDGSNGAVAARELFANRMREHFEQLGHGVVAPDDPSLSADIEKLQSDGGVDAAVMTKFVSKRFEQYEAQINGIELEGVPEGAPQGEGLDVSVLGDESIDPPQTDFQEVQSATATDGHVSELSDTEEVRVTAVDDLEEIDPRTFAALMAAASEINASKRTHDPAELERINAVMQHPAPMSHQPQAFIPGAGPSQGVQSVKTGAQALVEGGAALIGGAASLIGAAARGAGKGASALASVASGANAREVAETTINLESGHGVPLPTVLPRLSEYRILQAEKQDGAYEQAHEDFWKSDKMPIIRKEIEDHARQSGLSVHDVMEKMKPNGELAELHDKFTRALSESPAAQTHKKAMDKALDSWSRQYGRAQQELLNPQTDDSPLYQGLKDRLDGSHSKMQDRAASLPVFGEEDKSHLERLRETVTKVMEKLREVVKAVANVLRGRKPVEAEESADASHS